jgi:HK97 family phage major capsid protein
VNLPAPGTASGRTLSYLEETTFTNNAVETAEGSGAGEAALAFTERTITIEWLPVFIPVTEIAMSDIEWLESYLRGRLGFMVRQRLASQLLNGDGNTPNIKGYATFVTQTQAKSTDPVFDAIYKGLVKCRVNGFAEPDAIVMHPNDWQDVRLTRTADGIYILGNPADKGSETLFGLPIFQTTHETEGTALVGAFREHSQFIVRDGISLAASNSHDTYFTEGKVAIRASMRCALVVYRILAFTEVTGL